ncbi:MAG: alpha/beta hydrolase-fold protein [Bacteroidia bacterium]|nr:alpha/beta hydrolase-fold protein [Bacteroidia bacterium]
MKIKLLIISLFSSFFLPSICQVVPMGQVLEGLSMKSQVLGRDVNYAIYLPADYKGGTRYYPVVYLLHGYTDNETGWIQFGEVDMAADRAIASREIPSMIIVMPDAKATWYMNNADGSENFEDMFIQEFIPFIDKTYRTRAKKEFRGVSGLSMGGFGSLLYSLKHPEMFAACAAFSSAVWTDEEVKAMPVGNRDGLFEKLFGLTQEKTYLTPHYRANSILDLVGSLPKEQIEKVRFYIDCGDDDFLYKGNAALHVLLRDKQIKHEFRVRDGGHTWSYWRTGISDGLKFIGESFHR